MQTIRKGDIEFICGRWPLDARTSTLIFIHGSGESSLVWRVQVEGLKDRVNTVAIDLPGHGRSSGRSRQTIPEYASVLVEFITAIAAPNPIPCGLSMGGAITQQLLLDYPSHFRAGIIVSSGARLKVLPKLFEMIATDMDRYAEMVDRMGFSATTPLAIKRPVLEDSLRTAPQVVVGDFKACHAFDVMERLGDIRVPVLVISAADDQLTPPTYGDYLERHLPGAVRVHFQDCGHFAPVEKPAEVNAAITGFLDANQL
jgi:pimeloyl-ACP methyl ester carboxylesterase